MMNCIEITSNSVKQTQQIAKLIGKNLQGGECIELISDVGGGKTTFVRGLAKGAGTKDHISSPSFTISKVYTTPKFDIIHFDFYRLSEVGLTEFNFVEEIEDSSSVVVVEWSQIIKHMLPEKKLEINISVLFDESRLLELRYPNNLSYLLQDLK